MDSLLASILAAPTPLLGQVTSASNYLQPTPQALYGKLILRIWDVEHGACAMFHHSQPSGVAGRLAMIDSGDRSDWNPSSFIRRDLYRSRLDYLFITNADQDHMSGLQGLWDAGISIGAWHRNPSVSAETYRRIKAQSGPLTRDAERYALSLSGMTAPVSEPFDGHMGGIKSALYWNPYPTFTDTNNLSLVIFIKFGQFCIVFPGDIEKAGWLELLKNPAFRSDLSTTTILVASHHGRVNGYCKEAFEICHPQAVIMSDKAIVHDTQLTASIYHAEVIKNFPNGVFVQSSGKRRHVLTTRRDGHIQFEVDASGNYTVTTE